METHIATHIPGVPNVLKIMLEQLASKNTIHGWNIFEDRNGHVCLNIRFIVESSGHVSNSAAKSDLLGTQYRRVSSKQQSRNLKRVQEYKDTVVTRSKSKATPVEEIELACDSDTDTQSASFISVDTCSAPFEYSPSLPANLPRSILEDFLDPRSATVVSSPKEIYPVNVSEPRTLVSKDLPTEMLTHVDTSTQVGSGLLYVIHSSQTNPASSQYHIVQC